MPAPPTSIGEIANLLAVDGNPGSASESPSRPVPRRVNGHASCDRGSEEALHGFFQLAPWVPMAPSGRRDPPPAPRRLPGEANRDASSASACANGWTADRPAYENEQERSLLCRYSRAFLAAAKRVSEQGAQEALELLADRLMHASVRKSGSQNLRREPGRAAGRARDHVAASSRVDMSQVVRTAAFSSLAVRYLIPGGQWVISAAAGPRSGVAAGARGLTTRSWG